MSSRTYKREVREGYASQAVVDDKKGVARIVDEVAAYDKKFYTREQFVELYGEDIVWRQKKKWLQGFRCEVKHCGQWLPARVSHIIARPGQACDVFTKPVGYRQSILGDKLRDPSEAASRWVWAAEPLPNVRLIDDKTTIKRDALDLTENTSDEDIEDDRSLRSTDSPKCVVTMPRHPPDEIRQFLREQAEAEYYRRTGRVKTEREYVDISSSSSSSNHHYSNHAINSRREEAVDLRVSHHNNNSHRNNNDSHHNNNNNNTEAYSYDDAPFEPCVCGKRASPYCRWTRCRWCCNDNACIRHYHIENDMVKRYYCGGCGRLGSEWCGSFCCKHCCDDPDCTRHYRDIIQRERERGDSFEDAETKGENYDVNDDEYEYASSYERRRDRYQDHSPERKANYRDNAYNRRQYSRSLVRHRTPRRHRRRRSSSDEYAESYVPPPPPSADFLEGNEHSNSRSLNWNDDDSGGVIAKVEPVSDHDDDDIEQLPPVLRGDGDDDGAISDGQAYQGLHDTRCTPSREYDPEFPDRRETPAGNVGAAASAASSVSKNENNNEAGISDWLLGFKRNLDNWYAGKQRKQRDGEALNEVKQITQSSLAELENAIAT